MKKQFRNKKLPCLVRSTDDVCKSYIDSGFKDLSLIRNTTHIDFKDKNLDNFPFVNGKTSMPAVRELLKAKHYVN